MNQKYKKMIKNWHYQVCYLGLFREISPLEFDIGTIDFN
jgi:hypothetical protein